MKFSPKEFIQLLKQSFKAFLKDDAFEKAAAVSYYSIFSLPGFLAIVILLSSVLFFEDLVAEEINDDLVLILGEANTENLENILQNIDFRSHFKAVTIIALLSLIFGVTTLFIQLQSSLNAIWGVHKKQGVSFIRLLLDRLVSLLLVLILNFLFLLSMIMNTLIHTFNEWISSTIGNDFYLISYIVKFLLVLLIFTLGFSATFKVLPDVKIEWKTAWRGALVTALLFSIGEEAISLYLSHSDLKSSYGTASSVVFFLLWIYYSSALLFFGAEFTQAYAKQKGENILPNKYAQRIADYHKS